MVRKVRQVKGLTVKDIETAKPAVSKTGKPVARKLSDGGGLFLLVTPAGGKYWYLKYRWQKKEKTIPLGSYPAIPLGSGDEYRELKDRITESESNADRRVSARQFKREYLNLLAQGIDPEVYRIEKATHKPEDKPGMKITFRDVAEEYIAGRCEGRFNRRPYTEIYATRCLQRLEKDVFPVIGSSPILTITGGDLKVMLEQIVSRGVRETARRILNLCQEIFMHARFQGYIKEMPTDGLAYYLPMPVKVEHFAAATEPVKVGELLRAIDAYQGSFVVNCALKLAPLVFVRPGELRKAEWKDVDLINAEWRFQVSKTDTAHIVPLSKQAVAILKDVYQATGQGQYVFPSANSYTRPMSDNAILAAFRRMGISSDEMTGHGWRATARTLLDEVLRFPAHLIEHQLAHKVKDPLGRAYNRTTHIEERRKMMQVWADYLEQLKLNAAGK